MVFAVSKKPTKPTEESRASRPRSEPYTAREIRAGLLITLSAAALAAILFMAGNFQLFTETYQVRILFNYISGLAKNAPVHFAGHEVGKVTDIRILGQHEGQVAVTVSIAKTAVLRNDSQAFIDILGFMGEKFVELTPGTPEASPLKDNETLLGTDPIALNEIMKKGTEIADELEKTTVSLQGLIRNVDKTVAGSQSEVGEIFENLNEASRNLKEMTQDLKLHPWKLLRKGKEEKPDGKKRRFLFF